MRHHNLAIAALVASVFLSASGAWAHPGRYSTSPVHDLPGEGRPDPWCLSQLGLIGWEGLALFNAGCLGGFRFQAGHFTSDLLEFYIFDDVSNPTMGLVAQDPDGDGISAEPGEPQLPFCGAVSFSAFENGFSLSLPITVFVDGPIPESLDIGPIPPPPPSSSCTDPNPYHGGSRGIITHL